MVSRAIAGNKGKPFILRKGISTLSDLRDGASAWSYPGDYPGQVYFVNNIHGASTNDGLSWDQPFAQVSEAITASETYRALYAGTTNDYQRNIIYVQGTGTAYTAITALPNYCDIIGIGADVRGNGTGIARIGADSGDGGGLTGTATARGLHIENIQFQAGYNNYPFKVADLFRSSIVNCAFGTNGLPGASYAPAVGFEIGRASGLFMDNCHWINASGAAYGPTIGMNITGTHFHNAVVQNCHITGDTFGVVVASTTVKGFGSIFGDNTISGNGKACDVGVDDNATTGTIVYANNYLACTADGQLANIGEIRWVANKSTNGFSTVTAS